MTAYTTPAHRRRRGNRKDRQPRPAALDLPEALGFKFVSGKFDSRLNLIEYWRYEFRGFEFRITIAPYRAHWRVTMPEFPGNLFTVPMQSSPQQIADLLRQFAATLTAVLV